MIGIVSSFNEIVPGHMNLDKITEAVKMGVAMAGGMPVVFPALLYVTVLPWDMWNKYSLVIKTPDRRQYRVYGYGTRL